MKRKDIQELQGNSADELKKKLGEAQNDLVRFLNERYTKQSKNVREGRALRQTIARIKTFLREKELHA